MLLRPERLVGQTKPFDTRQTPDPDRLGGPAHAGVKPGNPFVGRGSLAQLQRRCDPGVHRRDVDAVAADIISKLVALADDGDPQATTFRNELAAAQAKGLALTASGQCRTSKPVC
jgi:hypothetical protein